jgi:hypothetical protein
MEVRWPGVTWPFELENFAEEARWVRTPEEGLNQEAPGF